jgi:hypothetical protein
MFDQRSFEIQLIKRGIAACCMLLSAATVVILASCNIVGPAAYFIEGPPSVDAQFVLKNVPTLVYVDDRQNVVNPTSLRRVISDKVGQDLMVNKCVTTVISGQDAMAITSQRERNSKIMSIEDIGNAVQARQVIYVEMIQFSDSPDGVTPRPVASARVRVIDLDTHEHVYPPKDADQPFKLVQAMGREVDIADYRSSSTRLPIFQNLADEMGSEVGKLFYKHEAKQLGGHLKTR